VVFMFKHCGQLVFEPGISEDKVMEIALEAGAEDIITDEDGSIEVITPPNDFLAVKEAFDAAGLKTVVAEVIMKPSMETVFTGDDAIKMQKILDALDDLDDVQDVYTTAVIED
jgi:transcriptional/translational regulatory protein YebC/TACO1